MKDGSKKGILPRGVHKRQVNIYITNYNTQSILTYEQGLLAEVRWKEEIK